jgi:hypothetical protein
MMQAWEKKVILKRANVQIRDNATAFLVDQAAGKYPEFDEDTAGKLGEKARKQLEDMERVGERTTKKIKDGVDATWSAQANFGQLDPAELDKALKNQHPYISPDRARALKAINENPPSGKGNQAAMTTWSQYLSNARSLKSISTARAELNRIQADIGEPNDYIMKKLNELQSDQTTLENQGISRDANAIAAQGREIKNIQTGYEADRTPVPPFVERLMGNRTAQDRARIDAEYRKNGKEAAEKLSKTLATGVKNRVESVPQKMKDVMEYGQ